MSKPKFIWRVQTSFENKDGCEFEILEEKVFESKKDAEQYAKEKTAWVLDDARQSFSQEEFSKTDYHTFNKCTGTSIANEDGLIEYDVCIHRLEVLPNSKKKAYKHLYLLSEIDRSIVKLTQSKDHPDLYTTTGNRAEGIQIKIDLLDARNQRESTWRKEKEGMSAVLFDTLGCIRLCYTNPASLIP